MQVEILAMPPVVGIPIDRRTPMSIDTVLRCVGSDTSYSWGNYNHTHELILGSNITRAPQKVHKVIHVSHDQRWVFETVFAVEENKIVCLYTKMIQDHIDIAISLNAIREYRMSSKPLIPLADIVAEQYWRKSPMLDKHEIHSLVPPIFTQSSLDRTTMQLVDIAEESFHEKRVGWRYRPIYEHEPSILEALISGCFFRPPIYELRSINPSVRITPDRWFCSDRVKYQTRVSAGYTHNNHPEFDSIALGLITMRPTTVSMTALISHAVDGLLDLGVTRHCTDPYLGILPISPVMMDKAKETLSQLIFRSVMAYCQIYDIDYSLFGSTPSDRSSISIEKNIYDEVAISFHDMINDRYVCFYTSFPGLALATMAVGHYTSER